MEVSLESPWLQLSFHTDPLSWDLTARRAGLPSIHGARLALEYRLDSRTFRLFPGAPVTDLSMEEAQNSPHGTLRQFRLRAGPDGNGVSLEAVFALPAELPLALWRFRVRNGGNRPVRTGRLTLLEAGTFLGSARAPGSSRIEGLASPAFFSNGWQSWSYAGVYSAEDRFRSTRLGFFRSPTDINAGTPRPGRRGRFASDFFGLLGDRVSRGALVAGFLSQRQHFGSLEADLAPGQAALRLWANGDGARLDPGAEIETDWACLGTVEVDGEDPLGVYLQAAAREHGLLPPVNPPSEGAGPGSAGSSAAPGGQVPTGWCSWYQYSSEDYVGALSESDIRKNLEALRALQPGLPLQVFQIDDGFESQIGDWFTFNPSFPNGVAPLAAEIASAGFTPGLWLAPFIAHPASKTARDHPEWLLRGRLGRPVNAGYLWNSFATALDLTHPGALDYARQAVHTAVHGWGYPYLKLDFLYAAALPGRPLDPSLTRAQILRRGLEALREAAGPEATLLGCGCPLGPAIGLVEAMRIGADTARRWLPHFPGLQRFVRGEPNLPAARSALHNALTRLPLHGRWWTNDPDCLLLNPGKHLNLDEVRLSASLIALTGGSLILSDDLAALPASLVEIAAVLLPVIGRRARVLDWFDRSDPQRLRLDLENESGAWHLLAQINWEDRPRALPFGLEAFGLDPQDSFWGRDFWSGRLHHFPGGSRALEPVPPHAVRLLALRRQQPSRPVYLGSSLHISQGLEAAGWEAAPGRLALRLERPGAVEGDFWLSLPAAPRRALLSGQSLAWRAEEGPASGARAYRFHLRFEKQAAVQIEW